MQTIIAPPSVPVGVVKSFGPFGPKYQVGQPLEPLNDGDWLVEIVLLETSEKVPYRRTRILDDPEAY